MTLKMFRGILRQCMDYATTIVAKILQNYGFHERFLQTLQGLCASLCYITQANLKFGCFSSINNKAINNFPQWGHFQPNFR